MAAERKEASAEEFTAAVEAFALSHEADDIGITPMDPLYVFEGYTIDEPTVIILAVGHNYERLKQVPSDETNGEGSAMSAISTRAALDHPSRWPIGFARKDTSQGRFQDHRRTPCF